MWLNSHSSTPKEKSLQSFSVKYLGGRVDLMPCFGELNFFENRLELIQGKKILFTLLSTDIESYSIEGKEDISRRITATRMIAFGVFALAAPKKSVKREQYLTLVLKSGDQLIFEHENRFINEAMFRGLMSTTFARISAASNR